MKNNPIRPTQQKRSLKTQQKILKVVGKLLREGQFEKATVQDIVRQSGSSIGAFYGRFKDKNAALFSFYDEHCLQLEAAVLPILDPNREDGLFLPQILSQFVQATVQHTFAHAEILRAGTIKFSDLEDDPFLARARRMNQEIYRALLAILQARRAEFEHPDESLAAMFVMGIVGSLTRDALTMGQKLMQTSASSQVLEKELTRMVFGYLAVSSA